MKSSQTLARAMLTPLLAGLLLAACSNSVTLVPEDAAMDAPVSADGGLDQGQPPMPDGGLPCCPAGFSLYPCHGTDGSPGLACHNPAQGCASSDICGQGCDPQVSGRCECSEIGTCKVGYHPDPALCQCVPNQDAAAVDGGCVETVLCIEGDHFDSKTCRCVPNQDAAAVDGGCVDNVLCIEGDHYDSKSCRCVPNQDAATPAI